MADGSARPRARTAGLAAVVLVAGVVTTGVTGFLPPTS